jgi:hypothetical protein
MPAITAATSRCGPPATSSSAASAAVPISTPTAQGKAIWVTHGDKIRIENIEFSGCHVPDGNGAAIRAEGAGLTLVNVFIHDKEDGLLSAPNPNSDIVVEDSEFAHNGTSSGATHGIYIGDVRNFVLRGSYFHDTVTGHHVKTRAKTS